MTYRVREVDASDEEIAEIIHDFNKEAEPKFPLLKQQELEGPHCYWWIAYFGKEPVAFSGMVPSRLYKNSGYLKRAFVTPENRGEGLQHRFFKARERKAREIGWNMLISECNHDNIHSANNFIRAGYRLFEPTERWAFNTSIYWKKHL